MSAPIRIVQFRRTSAIVGGPEKLLVGVAKYIDRAKFDLTVIDFAATARDRTPFLRQIGECGIATAAIPARNKFDVLRSVRYLGDWLREHRIDVLHTHDHRTDCIGYLATRKSSTATVVSVWQPLRRYWWLWHVEVLDELLIRRFDRILPCSTVVRDEILGKWPSLEPRMDLVPGGVDLEVFRRPRRSRAEIRAELNVPDDKFLCVFAGRIMEDKGLPYLVEAHRIIRAAGVDVHQLLIGEGPQIAMLRERIAALGLSDRIQFVAYREDLADVLEACDLLVHPSLSEGLSVALITAMAAGLAIVATDVGGTAESVLDGECGLLVQPRDPDALALRVMELVRDSERRQALARRGRELAFSRWSVERMVRDFERVYGDLHAERASRR